ncbi:discoidin domain-containing protein [Aquabacterium sp. A7-Y]|uniref:galactose-binding domain-containing protein n=1 Tax=Aquabacterium sp. A7-Y TaxID=1349605 RepID=UPI00223E434B|nr:discoidin domain-containing protein [Aquabacterium sp. A7-Y]MCW7540292.1 discoidin domain-containing protein [Aquabacterium sp. A7-Y]
MTSRYPAGRAGLRGGWPALTTLALFVLAACGGGRQDDSSASDGASGRATAGSRAKAASRSPRGAGPTREAPLASVITPLEDALIGVLPPTADAPERGMWSALAPWPLMAAHANLLPDGRVMSFGTAPPDVVQAYTLHFDIWSPALGFAEGAHRTLPNPTTVNSFCSASTMGPDGMLLIVGGNNPALYKTTQWDPDRDLLIARAAQPRQPRYYATLVRLSDNRILIVGGNNHPREPLEYAETPEVFTAAEGWQPLPGATSAELFGKFDARWWYPRAYVGLDGRVVGVSNDRMWRLDAHGAGRIESLGPTGHRLGVSGMSLMYRPGRLLLAGGGSLHNTDALPGTRQATLIDFGPPSPQVMPAEPMARARNWANAVALPDGQVLVTGGTAVGNHSDTAIFEAELWNPDTGRWRTLAPAAERRLYHSVSLLLPSGAVLNAGGGAPGPVFAQNAQVYFPPYFFRRTGGRVEWASRPAFTRVAPYFVYGPASDSTVVLADTRPIASAALVTIGMVTHSHGTDLRYVPLAYTQRGRELTLHLSRLDNRVVPPGHYQLHVVDRQGVPSPAAIVEFRHDPRNVAPQGTASQSSTWRAVNAAGVALDGRLDSYTHTSPGRPDPSWRLDLPATRGLSQISLFNRTGRCSGTDDCRTRLRDITVTVLDGAGLPVWTSELLNPENRLGSPDRLHVDLTHLAGTAVRGRSIVVQRRSDPDGSGSGGVTSEPERDVLSLSEVQVEEGPVNLALHRAAAQSSTIAPGVAALAVNGDLTTEWRAGGVTHTQESLQPWWQVDLGRIERVAGVRLWNRSDVCCADRLSDFHVLLSEQPFTSETLETERVRPGVTDLHVTSLNGQRAIDLALPPGRSGRYLRVWLRGRNSLSLAEVEVFAPAAP